MAKFIFTRKKEVEETIEIEVDFPVYLESKHGSNWQIKLVDETAVISVQEEKEICTQMIASHYLESEDSFIPSTEARFVKAYQNTINALDVLATSSIEVKS